MKQLSSQISGRAKPSNQTKSLPRTEKWALGVGVGVWVWAGWDVGVLHEMETLIMLPHAISR